MSGEPRELPVPIWKRMLMGYDREISPSSPLHFFGYPDITMKMMGETENQKSYISTVNPVKVKIQGLS